MPPRHFYEFCCNSLLSRFVEEIFIKTVNLAKYRINPIWVFDSLIDQSYFYPCFGVKREQAFERIEETFNESIELCKLMGVPIVKAENAEVLSSHIASKRRNTFIATDTLDGLMHTPEKLLVGLNKRHSALCELKLHTALAGLELTRDKFIDLCLLMKYISKYEVLTPMQGYKMIKKFDSIEGVLNNSSEDFKHRLRYLGDTKKQWMKRQVISDSLLDSPEIVWTKCNSEEVRALLKTHDINNRIIETGIEILNQWKPHNHYTYQTRIDQYFNEKKKIPGFKLIEEKPKPLKQTKISQFFELKYY